MTGDKSARMVRAEAAGLALWEAKQREKDGDPEGAEILRDLAGSIRAIEIRQRPGKTGFGER